MTTAQFVTAFTGQPFDPTNTLAALGVEDKSVAAFIATQRALPVYADVPMRAEMRVWGSYPHGTAAVTGRELPEARVVAAGVARPGEVRVTSDLTASAGFYLPSRRAVTA